MQVYNYNHIEEAKGTRTCGWCRRLIHKGCSCATMQRRKEGKTVRIHLCEECVDLNTLSIRVNQSGRYVWYGN